MVDIETLSINYFVNMVNVPYELKKGGTIYIKPILTKDYLRYQWAIQILTINKNEINDVEIIQMSYLDFLTKKIIPSDEETYKSKIWWVLHLCLGEEYFIIGDNCIIICNDDDTIKYVINSKEFDEIIQIILNQNDYNYDNRYVNPEVREMLNEYYKIKYKDISQPSLEKKKAFVSSKTGKSFNEINELPYREFDLIYDACKDSEIYIGQKIIQGSYKYQVEGDIKHPLFEPKKDMYEELFEDTSVLSSKGINGAEQLTAMNIQGGLNNNV